MLLVVGDVSGQGLRAATTMASLRYAALAYARARRRRRSSRRLVASSDRQQHEYFATVLCAAIDVARTALTLASAGHLAPLLIDADGARFVASRVGRADRRGRRHALRAVTVTRRRAGDAGRLHRRPGRAPWRGRRRRPREAPHSAAAASGWLDELVSQLIADLRQTKDDDDTTILGVRWRA